MLSRVQRLSSVGALTGQIPILALTRIRTLEIQGCRNARPDEKKGARRWPRALEKAIKGEPFYVSDFALALFALTSGPSSQ
jgi:hypothetical protein